MRSLVICLLTFMSLVAHAQQPTAMGLAVRHQADIVCESVTGSAKKIWMIIWYGPHDRLVANVRESNSDQGSDIDLMESEFETGDTSSDRIYESFKTIGITFSLDWDSRKSKKVKSPSGVTFTRWGPASVTIPDRRTGRRSTYELTCVSPPAPIIHNVNDF